MYSKLILSSFISFGQSFEPSCCTLSIKILYFHSSLVQDIISLPAMTLDYVILFLNVSIFFASGNLRFCLYFIFNISFTPWHTYSCVNCVISTIIWKCNRILAFIVWGWMGGGSNSLSPHFLQSFFLVYPSSWYPYIWHLKHLKCVWIYCLIILFRIQF